MVSMKGERHRKPNALTMEEMAVRASEKLARDKARWAKWRADHPKMTRAQRRAQGAEAALRHALEVQVEGTPVSPAGIPKVVYAEPPVKGTPVQLERYSAVNDENKLMRQLARESRFRKKVKSPIVTIKKEYKKYPVPALRVIEQVTPEIEDTLVSEMMAGNYSFTAARTLGISRATLTDWFNKAEKHPDSIYAKLTERIQNADARGEADLVKIVRLAAEKRWPAAAWLLERHFPERWGRRELNSEVPKVVVNIGIKLPGLGE